MPFTFTSPAVSISNIKMKWKEPYVTSGLNRKFVGVVPAGIYRGLRLGTNGTALTVSVVPDATHQDHLAVYETADGFSITYRDPSNTTYPLDLSDASLLSQTIVITLFLDYQEGKATNGSFIAYTQTEFLALAAAYRGELIVLGTVVNPASGVIAAASITNTRRTDAALNQSLLTWRQLVTNSGFEKSPDNRVLTGRELEGWRSTANWKTTSTGVSAGTRCAEFNVAAAGTYSDNIKQRVGLPVVAGQRIMLKVDKKVLVAASSGTGQVEIGFVGDNGGSPTTVTMPVIVTATDASYQTISAIVTAPTGSVSLRYISFGLTSAVYAASGAKIRIDNISVLLEPTSVDRQLVMGDDRLREASMASLTVEDFSSLYSDTAAMIQFDASTPSGEGTLSIARKDLDYTSNARPAAVSIHGRLIDLGSKLISNEANSLLPRIAAPISIEGSTDLTLMNEYAREGETTGTYTQAVMRTYAAPNGHLEMTVNAKWGGTTWSRDVAGFSSSVLRLYGSDMTFDVLTSTENASPWATWSGAKAGVNPPVFVTRTGVVIVGDVGITTGSVTLTADKTDTLVGAGRVLHGDYQFSWPAFGFGMFQTAGSMTWGGAGTPGVTLAAGIVARIALPPLGRYFRLKTVRVITANTSNIVADLVLYSTDYINGTTEETIPSTTSVGIGTTKHRILTVTTPTVLGDSVNGSLQGDPRSYYLGITANAAAGGSLVVGFSMTYDEV